MCRADPQQLVDMLFDQATNNVNYCFTFLPGLSRVHWPQDVWKVWLSDWAKSQDNGRDRQYV